MLDGATVLYGSASELQATLEYDFSVEKSFRYKGLTMDEIISHLADFVAGLWQSHIFGEGNTRTTAVFFIKYLRTLGFEATNDIFAENAWYFRNALVRANYNNLKEGIHETTEFLELFLRNLLLNEHNELKNRYMHIRYPMYENISSNNDKASVVREKANVGTEKADIESVKTDIETEMADIGTEKVDIAEWNWMKEKLGEVTNKSVMQVECLYRKYGTDVFFGRTDVMMLLDIKSSRASAILKMLLEAGITKEVAGHGKGKYKFVCKYKKENP